jgi:hypothetical protein
MNTSVVSSSARLPTDLNLSILSIFPMMLHTLSSVINAMTKMNQGKTLVNEPPKNGITVITPMNFTREVA